MTKFKRVSWKITAIVLAIVVIVAGTIAVYMQTRVINEIDKSSRLTMQLKLIEAAGESNITFTDATYSAASLRKFAEANFNVEAFIADAEKYFDSEVRPIMDGFVINIIERVDSITAAYFAVHPDLSGEPLVVEVYFEETDYGIESAEPQTYEEYMEIDSEDMDWFYGAYDSGMPFWTPTYEWDEDEMMVSYVEPIIIGAMIQNSMDKAAQGVNIADATTESFHEIASGINESGRLIGQIATSLDNQTTGIAQVNIGIDQVAQVVQQNSATAEQSAAASEEMSSQSTMLQDLVSQFKLKEGANKQKRLNPPASPK